MGSSRTEKRFGFDGAEFPLVRFTYPSSPLPADLPAYYRLKEVAARQLLVGRLLVAEARIVASPVIRGLINAFEWTRPQPRTAPLYVCENEIEARDWLRPYLEEIQKAKP